MKLVTLLGCLVLLLGNWAKADSTFVSGAVSGLWTADGSPYIVQGDLTVQENDTLQISPGVRVYFTGPFVLDVDSSAVLWALGAEEDSIVFTGPTDSDSTRWAGLYARYTSDTLRFRYCVFENATGRVQPTSYYYGAVTSVHNQLLMEHCAIRGNSSAGSYDVHGAGLRINDRGSGDGSYTINDCIFENNSGFHGGALGIEDGEGTISRCIFRNNFAQSGAAVYSFISASHYRDCSFTGNAALARGGAIWIEGNHGDMVDCEFTGNHSDGIGGAVCDTWGGGTTDQPKYEGCEFRNNSADSIGGAVIVGGNSTVKKCLFLENDAQDGGGLYYAIYSQPLTVTQCTFAENSASDGSAAVSMSSQPYGSFYIVNSAFADNEGNTVIRYPDCAVSHFRNNLIWENQTAAIFEGDACAAKHVVDQVNANGDSCDQDFNLYLDPVFVDAENGDFHLLQGSPMIDAGVTGDNFATTNDPDSTLPDIGVFYFNQTPSASDKPAAAPGELALLQNYPNPFNGETTIEFELQTPAHATLELFDITGRWVRTLFDGNTRGRQFVRVEMNDLASGIYIYRLRTPRQQLSSKMLLIR
ncbi:MAG: T9SS type A sorting domain-containing protein [Calditrichaeota bacterium]|nr:T9SS type A sorting domain-containing protein [Calditrichota bacterium]MCB9369318.1 T9SS type A sorting domain-containing protein [Calditrichota bacterium]